MTDRADPPVSAADLAENDSDEFVGALIDGASTPALTLLRILERRRYSAYAIAGRIAAHPSLRSLAIAGGDALLDLHPDDAIVLVRDEASPEVLTVLASYRTGAVREAVADCAATPPAALSILADDPLPNVRAFVASHPSTPTDALERLANDSDPQVRAHSLGSTGEALAALATNDDWIVRVAVASNPRTPPDVLASLAVDSNGSVRDSVSCNERAPIAALERLARDELHTVRESVAVHDAAPDPLLRSLAESDPHEHVRKLAALALRARSQ